MNASIGTQLELLKESVQKICESEPYQQYLKVMARFPSYSIRNTMLIYAQNPQATFVAGYQTWHRLFDRKVKKGEKGIRILAPYTYTQEVKDEQGEVHREKKVYFRAIPVFDVSQTQGKALPQLPKPTLLQGKCSLLEQKKPLLEKLTHFQIVFSALPEGHYGMCQYEEKQILINQDLEERHAFKTMIHECAHALLHSFEKPCLTPYESLLIERKDLREIEAESVSYVVCTTLGVECSEYSFRYVARWKQQENFLEESLERIAKVSQLMISALMVQDQESWIFSSPYPSQYQLTF